MRPEAAPRKSSPARRHTTMAALLALTLAAAASCASHPRATQSEADITSPDLWEMTIMAGRYGVMLSQARAILGLPEPAANASDLLSSDARDETRERRALSRYQVAIASEFFADAARACAKASAPQTIRELACSHKRSVSADLRIPAKSNLQSLRERNDALGALITPWWDAACTAAPKPAEGEDPACVME